MNEIKHKVPGVHLKCKNMIEHKAVKAVFQISIK